MTLVFMQMQDIKKSRLFLELPSLQIMIWASIFMLVGKLVGPHFELAARHDSQTEMEDIFPPTYQHSSFFTGWQTEIDQSLA